jgi:hypothetical protein
VADVVKGRDRADIANHEHREAMPPWRCQGADDRSFDKVDTCFAFLASFTKESAPVALGQFNRRENDKTQPKTLAPIQVATGEVWGRTPRNGLEPAVQAYAGKLRNCRGIEFTTLVDPHPDGSPFEVRWYLTATPGVEHRRKDDEDFACIRAVVVNMQP